MPDFTFTSPEGKNYTVSGPEGATKEQAFQVLQSQLAAGTASEDKQSAPPANTASRVKDAIAKIGSENPLNKLGPSNEPTPSPTMASAARSIAGSSAFGGVAGALSPEIVTGLGMAASLIPVVGPEISSTLVAAGTALRAGRVAAAVTGAVSGATSEGAGQLAEAAGATKGQANAARLVGGLATPGAGAVAQFVSKPARLAWGAAQKLVGAAEDVPKAVEAARQNMAKMVDAGQPQVAMHALLQKGVEADRQAAEKAADAVMADAHQRAATVARTDADAATRLVDEARVNAAKIKSDAAQRAAVLEKASDGKLATANRVLAQAAPELAKVGQVRELSDIGTTVRQAATVKQGAELEARNNAYKATVAERDSAVAAKEKAGQSVDDTPAMVALKKDLAAKLGVKKGFVSTVDAGVRRNLEQIQTAITRGEGQKTSFEALDQVRRKLGDVIAGKQNVEGYEAISKQNAQKMYAQISKAQEQFVGKAADGRNVQRELQQNYAEGSEGLVKYATKPGQKLTAVDRVDPERFAGDPKDLPGAFFKSQQGVRDLRELTGNPDLVNRQASDYAARSMQGMSAKQARNWVRDNNDWLREIPGLPQRVGAYANKLEQIERVAGRLGKKATAKEAEAGAVRAAGNAGAEEELQAGVKRAGKAAEGSVATQERVLADGSKAASAARDARFADAKGLESVLKGGEAPEAVRDLLLNGKPAQTRFAAQHLAGQPGGQQVLEGSVRQVMRNMTEGNLRQQWSERIRPMLADGKMLPPERLQALEKDVERLLAAYKGPERLTLVQRHIAAALGTVAGPNYVQ